MLKKFQRTTVKQRTVTPEELEVAKLVAKGYRSIDISIELGVALLIVKSRIRSLYDKLGLWNRVELALWNLKREEELQKAKLIDPQTSAQLPLGS